MKGASLMRDAAVLGAECTVGAAGDQVPDVADGWTANPERRAALAGQIREHLASDDPTLRRAIDRLRLDPLDYLLFATCAAVELHPEAAAAASIIAEDARLQLVTPTVFARLMRSVLDVRFATALAAAVDGGAVQRLGLVEVIEPFPGLPRTHHALRLTGSGIAACLASSGREAPEHGPTVRTFAPAWRSVYPPAVVAAGARLVEARRTLVLRTASRRAGRQLALDIAGALERGAHLVDGGEQLPPLGEVLELPAGVIVLDLYTLRPDAPLPRAWLADAAKAAPTVVVVGANFEVAPLAALDVEPLSALEAERAWAAVLEGRAAESMAARFRVGREEIEDAVREATDRAEAAAQDGAKPGPATLAAALRAQGARRMSRQVSVLEPRARLDRLVAPPALHRKLADIVTHHRHARRVFGEMGVARQTVFGRGLTCMFAGKPGTGKTFAAMCLGAELDLNVYRIDLSQIVSKYIGDTEKALAGIFEEAEAGHGLLLFDEADALFGKRSEVKDAHDRYANIEVGYLLQKLESFDGVTVLTTNLQGNLDPAFARRLRFIVEFPPPDRSLRRQLWDQALPDASWRAPDLDLDGFAERFALTGGTIHNIGIGAAHLAAATPSGRVTNAHLARATALELEKSGRPFGPDAFGPLAGHLVEAAA